MQNTFDVIIVGAGISGIAAAHYLQRDCPNLSFAILEMREALGGTWDLFRYPGIRSDSDIYTFGYAFSPWKREESIVSGEHILSYIKDTAKAEGIDKKITYGHKINAAAWSTEKAQWTIDVKQVSTSKQINYQCNFLYMCTGYYDYDQGYLPEFSGIEEFSGTVIHPQKWPEKLDCRNKKIVVIGSGATAITLIPSLAEEATEVTMLQRSPTYVVSNPAKDAIANRLMTILPDRFAHNLIRWKNILLNTLLFQLAQYSPKFTRKMIAAGVKKELGEDYDWKKHFKPKYNPWDQRLCLTPDSDFFQAIKKGKANIVTDEINRITPTGILLKSGEELAADMIITATGINVKFMADMEISIDGRPINIPDLVTYRGIMFNDIPNLALATGYINLSWTLKVELTSQYICRLLNHMKKKGKKQCTPRLTNDSVKREELISLTSGYFARAADRLPKQGSESPWKLHQNYFKDIFNFKYSRLTAEELEYK